MHKRLSAGITLILLITIIGSPSSFSIAKTLAHNSVSNLDDSLIPHTDSISAPGAPYKDRLDTSEQPNITFSTNTVTVTHSYDSNGNLLSDGESCYTYNDANQLSAVRNCTTHELLAEYFYDHTGQRVIEKLYETGQLIDTVYTIGERYETRIVDGSREDTSYYRANQELIARRNPDNSVYYYHTDHLGSISALTNESGVLIEETRYYPYGTVREGGTASRYLYTGQESDPETGLYYYRSRFYSPELCRFTQADSLIPDAYDPQQLNLYSYAGNSPLNYIDPSGHAIESFDEVRDRIILVSDQYETANAFMEWYSNTQIKDLGAVGRRLNKANETVGFMDVVVGGKDVIAGSVRLEDFATEQFIDKSCPGCLALLRQAGRFHDWIIPIGQEHGFFTIYEKPTVADAYKFSPYGDPDTTLTEHYKSLFQTYRAWFQSLKEVVVEE